MQICIVIPNERGRPIRADLVQYTMHFEHQFQRILLSMSGIGVFFSQ